jgi:hypothetical protein
MTPPARRSSAADREPISERLARFAWVAATFAGTRWGKFEDWTEQEFGHRLDLAQVDRHVKPIRAKSKRGRPPAKVVPRPERTPMLSDWLLVDEAGLGLLKVLFEVPGVWQAREALHEMLEATPGVRQFIEVDEDYSILVLALARTRSEANDLRARLQEHVPHGTVTMRTVRAESFRSTPKTWADLVRRELEEPLGE